VAALEQTLNEIARRHEILRTTFGAVDGRPIQIIAPELILMLPIVDLQELPEAEQEAETRRLAAREARQSFDLARGPLWRVALLQLEQDHHVVLFTMHHIISDGWSMSVLIREVGALYQAFANSSPSPLTELPIQYADFAYWQRQWLQGEVLEQQLSYWKQQLADIPPILELPTDRPRPVVQTFHGRAQYVTLSKELSGALKELSQREGVTLFMTFLAAFKILLHRYTGRDDILVGTAVANRNRAEIEQLIGFFVNTLVLRTDLSGNPSFQELLGRVREITLGAYAHQDLPFEKLVSELQPERNTSHAPLVQVAFQLQNAYSQEAFEHPGITLRSLEVASETAKFDLTLSMLEAADRVSGTLEYNTDLFNDTTITRMLRHFQTLLEGIVANPEQRSSDLPLLTEAELKQLLVDWNDTGTDHAQGQCIHELFEAQVERMPDAVALTFEDSWLTYLELNRRANQLGHHLQNLGVGPEVLVGICVERSLEMVIGLLGVLKAGGAYIPIDPTYPQERLALMLEETQAPVLLTQQSLLERLPDYQGRMICLDTEMEDISKQSEENPQSGVTPENLAYVIFTSGSTGRPKGTLLQHRGLCNFITANIRNMSIRAESCVLQFASFSFDASVAEIFTALLAGAKLCLVKRETLLSGSGLIEFLQEQAVTAAILPPSMLGVLPIKGLPGLRTVISAGESCPAEMAARWASGRRFINAYGPTEASVGPTWYLIENASKEVKSIPIGRPIENIKVYLLDRNLRPVPVGVAGQLHIGGVGLARGYLNRAELTAEKFIPDPFNQQGGARLYQTGDLARYLPDGNLEYLGRLDHQVKIRGYRIELEEIQTALKNHSLIEEALVTANPDQNQVIAYYTAQSQAPGVNHRLELWPSVAEFFVYDEVLYYAMTHDERRNQSYRVAFNRHVRDKVVLDIGAGKDAILSRLCVEAGARRVYAIGLLEESYRQAKECIRGLGLEDRITLIHGDTTQVQLPEKVDVCVSEIVGPIGGCEGAASILNDARRFLKDDGVMVPARSTTRIAALTLPEDFLNAPAFSEVTARYVEKIFEQVGYQFDLRLCLKGLDKSCLLSNIEVFEDLDFAHPVPLAYSHEVDLRITKNSRLDGFLVWLNLYPVPEEVIDILEHEHCWLPVCFPVFYPGIEVSSGDRIKAVISSQLCENHLNPDYKVKGSLIKQDGEVIDFDYDSFHYRRSFRKTPFYNSLFSADSLKMEKKDGNIPSPNDLRAYLKRSLPDYMIPSAFVRLEEMPLTPSGKIDRRALPAPDQARSELEEKFVAPRTPEEELLADIFRQVLNVSQVGIHDNFFELGGDSIRGIQVIARANQAGLRLTPTQLFQSPTIEALAEVAGGTEAVRAEQGMVRGRVPLAPIQHFFFEQRLVDPHHWNWAFLREVPRGLDVTLLAQAVEHLLVHHDALRLRFRHSEAGWEQFQAEVDEAAPVNVIDLSAVAAEAQTAVLEAAVNALQGSLNLAEGPLLRVAYFDLGEGASHRVLIIFHHLVVDVVSTRILMEDFQTAFGQLSRGEAVQLPAKTTSYQAWSEGLMEYAQSAVLREEVAYWEETLGGEVAALPADYPGGENSEASADLIITALGAEETRALLQEVAAASGAQVQEVLLAALVKTFAGWTGEARLLVEVEGHGREDLLAGVDVTRTVGWFTSIYPVLLDARGATEPRAALKMIREQLRQIPRRGIGYGLLRYLCEDEEVRERMRRLPRAEVNFNYLGQLDQQLTEATPFRGARERKGPERSLRARRFFALYVVGSVRGGVLRMHWNYSRNIYRRETIDQLARSFMEELRTLISSCLSPEASGRTLPSSGRKTENWPQNLPRFSVE
jgi:amino acid adenylation domain-containing protein/non-ribosomal peptide synthase protein (TIGR01720 family)